MSVVLKEEDGLFYVLLGKIDQPTRNGIVYKREVMETLLPGLNQRAYRGALFGELGPSKRSKTQAGESNAEYIGRLGNITIDRACCEYKTISLQRMDPEVESGPVQTAIVGLIKPRGPYVKSLLELLRDPASSCYFGLRAFVKGAVAGSDDVMVQEISSIVTWDFYVNDPPRIVTT